MIRHQKAEFLKHGNTILIDGAFKRIREVEDITSIRAVRVEYRNGRNIVHKYLKYSDFVARYRNK